VQTDNGTLCSVHFAAAALSAMQTGPLLLAAHCELRVEK